MVTMLLVAAAVLGLLGFVLYFLFSGPNPGPAKGTLEGFNRPVLFRRLGLRLVVLSAILAGWVFAVTLLG
jgi:hypothetical protein